MKRRGSSYKLNSLSKKKDGLYKKDEGSLKGEE